MLAFLSRVLGFVRQMLFASLFGASPAADLFTLAFSLPNLVRRFIADGIFTPSLHLFFNLCPTDSRLRALQIWKKGVAAATGLMIVAIAGFFLVRSELAPKIQNLSLFSKTGIPELLLLVFILGALLFPLLLSAVYAGVLSTQKKLATTAFAPLIGNAVSLGAFGLAYFFWISKRSQVSAGTSALVLLFFFAVSLLLGGFAQLLVNREGVRPFWGNQKGLTPSDSATPKTAFKEWLTTFAPVALSLGAAPIMIGLNRLSVATETGVAAHLYYAELLFELPLTLLAGPATQMLTAQLLDPSAHPEEQAEHFENLFKQTFYLAAGASLGLYALATPIVSTLYFSGAFHHRDLTETASALQLYALALGPLTALRFLLCFAFGQSAFRAALASAILAFIINFFYLASLRLLHCEINAAAVAAGVLMALLIQLAALSYSLRGQRLHFQLKKRQLFALHRKNYWLSLIAGLALLSLSLWFSRLGVQNLARQWIWDLAQGRLQKFLVLAAVISVCGGLYLIAYLATDRFFKVFRRH